MKFALAGLAALCVFAFAPSADAARSQERSVSRPSAPQARPATQASRPAAQASRPAASAPRAAVAPRNAAASRSAAPSRQAAVAPRNGRQQQAQARGRAIPAPYTRQAAISSLGMRQTAMATCTTRNGRRTCIAAPRSVSLRWTSGMPAPSLEQMSCPDGTMATTALGHSDVVRCVPL
jgi:hypothetical protein